MFRFGYEIEDKLVFRRIEEYQEWRLMSPRKMVITATETKTSCFVIIITEVSGLLFPLKQYFRATVNNGRNCGKSNKRQKSGRAHGKEE